MACSQYQTVSVRSLGGRMTRCDGTRNGIGSTDAQTGARIRRVCGLHSGDQHKEIEAAMPHPVPRKHHIVPAFYLAGFTPTDARNGKLYVFDHSTVKHYRTSPEKACRETDYNKINADGVPPYLIEDVLGWHENVVAPHVRAVAQGTVTNSRREIGETLALAASIAVRSRRGRAQLETAVAASLGMALRRGDVSEEKWERIRASELRHGVAPELLPPYGEAMEKLTSGDWFPRAPAVVSRGFVPDAQDAVMNMLLNRHWELAVTDADANGGFISSDSPLVWGDLDEMVVGRQQSLSSHDLEITFPVGRKAALISYPDARDCTVQATDEIVARINARTLHLSAGLIFHAHDDFLLRRQAGDMRYGSEYIAYQQDARRRGILNP